MDIVICTDKNFIMPTGVLMQSICVNNYHTDINFHIIIDESVISTDKTELEGIANHFNGKTTVFYSINSKDFSNLPSLGSFGVVTQATYYRLALTNILPSNIEKIIYLDCDIIVRGSLIPLWNWELQGYAIAAASEPPEMVADRLVRLNIPQKYGYFNAGVLVVNLEYWRSHNSIQLFSDYIHNHRESILYHDQDVLNAVFYDKRILIPIKYNLQGCYLFKQLNLEKYYIEEEIAEARANPVIVHFSGGKPWEFRRYLHPYKSSFTKYKSQTRWKSFPIQDNRPLKERFVHFLANILRILGLKRKDSPFLELTPID